LTQTLSLLAIFTKFYSMFIFLTALVMGLLTRALMLSGSTHGSPPVPLGRV
jgi:hypothetical protein